MVDSLAAFGSPRRECAPLLASSALSCPLCQCNTASSVREGKRPLPWLIGSVCFWTLVKCSCSIFSNGYGHSHLECCYGSHQSGCCTAGVGQGAELYRAKRVRMRACLARRGRRMRTEKKRSRCTGSRMKWIHVSKIWGIGFRKACLSTALRVSGKQLPEPHHLTFCCVKLHVTFSTSHQVTAKSFWQQRGAHIISEGEDHSEHLTPRGPALWATDTEAKWDRP